jgi:hypothetical protein
MAPNKPSYTEVLAACAVNKISERFTHSNAKNHSQ